MSEKKANLFAWNDAIQQMHLPKPQKNPPTGLGPQKLEEANFRKKLEERNKKNEQL